MRKIKETITFVPFNDKKLVLPIQYNHLVQAMIYDVLNEELASFLHQEGFKNEKRVFKMFTFSRLIGDYFLDRKQGKIIFNGPVKLTISSVFNEFSNSIGNGLLSKKTVRLANNQLEVKEISVVKENIVENEIKIETLSPIVVYSTLYRKDGKKFTYYFNPQENDFSELISQNLKNKYKAFYLKDVLEEVILTPIGYTKLSVVKYKGFIIKGYTGRFVMKGPIPLLQMGVDTGLGSKSSQGFGCIKII
ncbi:CRISPR-associated endoribonuclease Cas6 [Anaerosalibacter sp. Marseille-P3206]|uniref:CRISPR-associated endoribonuclease Cas6 n=1 Tax=Anaerosalibacter sp. Marseille-P3206 TaxID=1871005 RepID=UPI00190EAD93|nr:CRISPR-associated endoribonuclease Cas6 [Anaerosalibacter sp. Marseille-P3206]